MSGKRIHPARLLASAIILMLPVGFQLGSLGFTPGNKLQFSTPPAGQRVANPMLKDVDSKNSGQGNIPDDAPAGHEPEIKEGCGLPDVDKSRAVVALGHYSGRAISSVSLGSPDEVTTAARVVIEQGSDPLYIVLSAQKRTIWRFEGDVSRVDKVILTGAGSGVTGVYSGRVTVSQGEGCFKLTGGQDDTHFRIAAGLIGGLLKRDPTTITVGSSQMTDIVSLPSMRLSDIDRGVDAPAPKVPAGFESWAYRQYLRSNPAGVAVIEPGDIVSREVVKVYDVLPAGAGMSALVADGSLVMSRKEKSAGGVTYRIAKPIPRFPAGLDEGPALRFTLGTGVPLPAGTPGKGCVTAEDSAVKVGGSIACKR